jgi:hypothetical protein
MKKLMLTKITDVLGDMTEKMIRCKGRRKCLIERNSHDSLEKILANASTELRMHVVQKLLMEVAIR